MKHRMPNCAKTAPAAAHCTRLRRRWLPWASHQPSTSCAPSRQRARAAWNRWLPQQLTELKPHGPEDHTASVFRVIFFSVHPTFTIQWGQSEAGCRQTVPSACGMPAHDSRSPRHQQSRQRIMPTVKKQPAQPDRRSRLARSTALPRPLIALRSRGPRYSP